MKQRGWSLNDVYYDNHYTYPVPRGGLCSNEEICRFVLDVIMQTEDWEAEDDVQYRCSCLSRCSRRFEDE